MEKTYGECGEGEKGWNPLCLDYSLLNILYTKNSTKNSSLKFSVAWNCCINIRIIILKFTLKYVFYLFRYK